MAQTIDYQRPNGSSVNGYSPLGCVDASKVRAPVAVQCGEHDNPFTIDGMSNLKVNLRGAKLTYTGHCYVARQSFANQASQGPR